MSTSPRIRPLTPCSQVDPCEKCGHMAVYCEGGYRICKKCGWVYEKCKNAIPQSSDKIKQHPTYKQQERILRSCCSFPVFIRGYFPYILLSLSIVAAIALTLAAHIVKI